MNLLYTLLQDLKASLEDWTALSTSLGPEEGTSARTFPDLGSKFLNAPEESTGWTRSLFIQLNGPLTLLSDVDAILIDWCNLKEDFNIITIIQCTSNVENVNFWTQ